MHNVSCMGPSLCKFWDFCSDHGVIELSTFLTQRKEKNTQKKQQQLCLKTLRNCKPDLASTFIWKKLFDFSINYNLWSMSVGVGGQGGVPIWNSLFLGFFASFVLKYVHFSIFFRRIKLKNWEKKSLTFTTSNAPVKTNDILRHSFYFYFFHLVNIVFIALIWTDEEMWLYLSDYDL